MTKKEFNQFSYLPEARLENGQIIFYSSQRSQWLMLSKTKNGYEVYLYLTNRNFKLRVFDKENIIENLNKYLEEIWLIKFE